MPRSAPSPLVGYISSGEPAEPTNVMLDYIAVIDIIEAFKNMQLYEFARDLVLYSSHVPRLKDIVVVSQHHP